MPPLTGYSHRHLPDLDRSWVADAACRHIDTHLMYPHRGESAAQAKAVCARCPVRAECLEWALAVPEKFGIWGGLSERERRTLRAERAGKPTCERDDCWRVSHSGGLCDNHYKR